MGCTFIESGQYLVIQKVAFEKTHGHEGLNHIVILGKNISGRANGRYKDLETRVLSWGCEKVVGTVGDEQKIEGHNHLRHLK
jgi:hypothetical protein